MIEKIDKELELWEHYYNENDNTILESVLIDILAAFTKEEAQAKIEQTLEILKNLEKPLSTQEAINTIKYDIETLEKVKEEAKIAYRTLGWIKEELNKEDTKKEDE